MADKITIKLSRRTSLSEKPELPIDGLPASVREYIETVCDIYHCPREFVTTAVLATAATAVGKKIKLNEGITNIYTLYTHDLKLWQCQHKAIPRSREGWIHAFCVTVMTFVGRNNLLETRATTFHVL